MNALEKSIRLQCPQALYEDLLTCATIEFKSLSQLMIKKLHYSLTHNDIVMMSDRLNRLIHGKAFSPLYSDVFL